MSEVESSSQPTPPIAVHPLRSLSGAIISAFLGLLMYRLTSAIALSFATHPIVSDNRIVHNLSAAVRTLVVGICAMATGIFTLVTLGLIGLAIQVTLQQWLKRTPTP
jgi:Protein of unknown function (DUF3082)